jgi:ribosome-binding protein aMBF1 (putative translation factor)
MATAKCPVCGWEIKGKGKEVKVGDRTVVVCCEECAAAVKKDPAKHAPAR